MNLNYIFIIITIILFSSCRMKKEVVAQTTPSTDVLPPPYATKSAKNFSNVVGWKNDETPKAPDGFVVKKYAEGFENPRWMYVTPNGDVLVVESNSNHPLLERIGAFFI